MLLVIITYTFPHSFTVKDYHLLRCYTYSTGACNNCKRLTNYRQFFTVSMVSIRIGIVTIWIGSSYTVMFTNDLLIGILGYIEH